MSIFMSIVSQKTCKLIKVCFNTRHTDLALDPQQSFDVFFLCQMIQWLFWSEPIFTLLKSCRQYLRFLDSTFCSSIVVTKGSVSSNVFMSPHNAPIVYVALMACACLPGCSFFLAFVTYWCNLRSSLESRLVSFIEFLCLFHLEFSSSFLSGCSCPNLVPTFPWKVILNFKFSQESIFYICSKCHFSYT